MSLFSKPEVPRASLSDRRTTHRGPTQTRCKLTLLDGPGAGTTHEIVARDQPMVGLSFLMRDSLSVGQQCRVEFGPGTPASLAEIVRARPISGGRYEMAMQLRKA